MTATALKVAEIQADAAAADAARDARAEAMEQAVIESKTQPRRTKGKAPRKRASDGWNRFVVDIWITDLNFTEFGIYKRTRNRAKSRQFTTDMDIFGEIIEDGKRTGLFGYREDAWKKAEGMDKRLVFKLFTDNLNWRATMDLMVGRSLQQTIGARGMPVMTYSINTNDDQFIIYLERSANKWPFMPEHFSFFIIDNSGKPEFYRLKRAFINLGGDYSLINQHGETVGYLDGKVFSIGGKWKGQIRAGADKRLMTVMNLFGAMMVFNRDCRHHMKRLYKGMLAGKVKPELDRQEADLYMNPRRVR
ncbi:hypothetical protein [Hyphomicrobium sp. CS1GBMeth3]|uniref:hypothetical protein n=1 Tax=Hyphomicrobium sp. CS1GBMeth3 TaxID=1892845 RepID=UPI000931B416|nr:hypothetical protein [Hyphomicrobium sp. CS1GBMeth3]